jgi:hypothetical protein
MMPKPQEFSPLRESQEKIITMEVDKKCRK